jgi:hypothetical protein
MAPKNKMEITHGGKKYTVFSKVTGLVGRTENGEDMEHIIFGPEREGVVSVAVLSAKELDTEALALRVSWFLEANPKPRCVGCGAAYNGRNYVEVSAIRNGTYYLHVVCDRCQPRITWVHSIVTGRS